MRITWRVRRSSAESGSSKKEESGSKYQRPCQRDALLLSTREFALGRDAAKDCDAEPIEATARHAVPHIRGRHSLRPQTKADILRHGQVREEGVVLRHEAPTARCHAGTSTPEFASK